MIYETFLNKVTKQMTQELGEGYGLILRKVPKNNRQILDGLCTTHGDDHVAPAIYLNLCYDQYLAGRPMEDIVTELITLYQKNHMPPDLDYARLARYRDMKLHITCKLIHAVSNQSLLEEIPHVLWLDLAIAFYLCIHEDDSGLMTTVIHNNHLDVWDVSLEELKETALANTPSLFPPVIASMSQMIEDLSRVVAEEESACFPSSDQSAPFLVLSNTSGISSAAYILYPDVVKNFAEIMEKDIIILPSSVREVLLLPDEGDVSCDEMSRFVTHINQTEVPKEDCLSNQVYLCSRIHQALALASGCMIPIY